MKQRCYNPKNPEYKNYGLRNIQICDEWLNNRLKFIDWAYKNGYKDDLTIERIDVNGNYCPENCTWIKKRRPIKKHYKNKIYNYRRRNSLFIRMDKNFWNK